MKNPLSIIKSSFHDIRCCDEQTKTVTDPQTGVTTAWRGLASSLACVVDANGTRTGYAHLAMLEEYDAGTNLATGVTKPNSPSDANFIADYPDNVNCSVVLSNNYIELISETGALTKVTANKGASDVFTIQNADAYTRVDVPPGSYALRVFPFAPPGDPVTEYLISVNGAAFESAPVGIDSRYYDIPTPISIYIKKV